MIYYKGDFKRVVTTHSLSQDDIVYLAKYYGSEYQILSTGGYIFQQHTSYPLNINKHCK